MCYQRTIYTVNLRYYVDGKQKFITLAPKNDLYRSWNDVEPLIERVLGQLNSHAEIVTGSIGLIDYVEKHYLPWCQENKAAVTANSYWRVWGTFFRGVSQTDGVANLRCDRSAHSPC